MKGTPQFPQCGFSARTVELVSEIGVPFAYVNILENPDIRANLPKYANWPTFPQLWVKGELVGGCDIITELAQSGELKNIVESAKVQNRNYCEHQNLLYTRFFLALAYKNV